MKVVDRDGNVTIPRGKPLRLVMADSVQHFVRWVARLKGVTGDRLMLTTLVDEEVDPDAPIYLFCHGDGKGNTSLVATQDSQPYREHLIAIRDGRQPDDPLIAVSLQPNARGAIERVQAGHHGDSRFCGNMTRCVLFAGFRYKS